MKKYEFKPYNPASPKLFKEEKNRLAEFLSGNYRVEHIGSTAVPSLGGKGIVDIMIAVPKDRMQATSEQAQKAGYIFRPLASTDDRLFLRTVYPENFEDEKVYHLHITYPESQDWKEALAFRDYLRTHPKDLDEYAETKKKAAEEANENTDKYKIAKEFVLKEILNKALNKDTMPLEDFKKQKVIGREILLNKIIETIKGLNPIAIHQFGSGRYGYQDEFSDFDLWITFPDDKIKEIVDGREDIFSSVAPVLVKSDAPQNAPIGGSYTLVLYNTEHGIFHVDYYLAPKSGSNVREDAKHLHGDDTLPRGEWVLNREAVGKWTPEHVYDQMLAMSYIMNKAIVRGGWNVDMAKYLRELYKDYQEITNKTLLSLPDSDEFEFIKELYENILHYGSEIQQKAVKKLREYSELIERLYV